MLNSTKSIIYISFFIVGISLFLVIILGARQFQMNREYSEITGLSERALFTFATLREQVTESLISRDYQLLKGVIPEIEELNNTISRFFDSSIVPGQYKLALTDRIDLAGLVIDLRKVGSDQDDPDSGLKIQQDLRVIGDNLFKIDRVITGQIRNSVISFQLGMIGAMGLLISCTSFILVLLYRKTIAPIFNLSRQISSNPLEHDQLVCSNEVATEIIEITASLNRIIAEQSKVNGIDTSLGHEDQETISRTINETANNLNGMINYAQLLMESDSQLAEDQKRMLEQIIDSGERIADQWRKVSQRFSG